MGISSKSIYNDEEDGSGAGKGMLYDDDISSGDPMNYSYDRSRSINFSGRSVYRW